MHWYWIVAAVIAVVILAALLFAVLRKGAATKAAAKTTITPTAAATKAAVASNCPTQPCPARQFYNASSAQCAALPSGRCVKGADCDAGARCDFDPQRCVGTCRV